MHADVQAFLAPDGPLARALGGRFEPRPQQVRMAEGVGRAFEERSRLVVEAGTGVGKSFAYLIPAALRCVRQGETVVVATNTIALQEQLVERDIPFVQSVLGDEGTMLRPVLVKGRGNYVSLRRLALASKRQETLLPDAESRRSLHVIEDWAYETRDGTLSTLPPLPRAGVWERAQSDAGNCLGRACPTHDRCFYQSARRRMEQGNLLICNHALFFSDLSLRARGVGFLPEYDHLVLDEAHGVEDVAGDHFGVSVSTGRVNGLLHALVSPRGDKGFLPSMRTGPAPDAAIGRLVGQVHRAHAAAAECFAEIARTFSPPAGGEVRLAESPSELAALVPLFADLALALQGLIDRVADPADRAELNAYALRAGAIAEDVPRLTAAVASGHVCWARFQASPAGEPAGRVEIVASPVEVAPLLTEHLWSKPIGVVLASATLAIGDERDPFSHTRRRLGCADARTLRLDSPFEYARQAELIIDRRAGSPEDSPRGHERLAGLIAEHARSGEGGVFVLFTSLGTMRSVAPLLAPLLDPDRPLLVQDRDGPRGQLLDRFRAHGRAVLMGADSFWQGVDVPGQALRTVIITKLPFDPPDRPLTQARGERIKARGGNPFMEDALPRAVLRFKQGFGRLIRTASDQGRVVVLDSRLLTARYGRVFLESLPPGLPVRTIPKQEDLVLQE